MGTILLADDYITTRKLLIMILSQKGDHRFLEAANAAEALRMTRDAKPDLIITDLHMVGDGGSLAHVLRDDPATATIPIVIYTVHVEELPPAGIGPIWFLRLPGSLDDVVALVEQALRGGATDTAAEQGLSQGE